MPGLSLVAVSEVHSRVAVHELLTVVMYVLQSRGSRAQAQ